MTQKVTRPMCPPWFANRETVLQTWDKSRLSSDFDVNVKSEECADESRTMCDKTEKKFQDLARSKKRGMHVLQTNCKLYTQNCLFGGIYGTGMNPSFKSQIIRHPNSFLTSILNAMDPMSMSRIIATA
jgi:hypothetical protein